LTVGGTLKVDGALDASGNPGLQDDSGGGAGGSIWITANALSGSGTIAAGGGPGELFGGGGGGGGRIAIYSPSNAFTGSYSTAGGLGANIGEPGTLVLSGTLPSILGTITDTNGQPVAGVTLQANLGGASTTSGVDGTYTLALVPYAGFTVTPVLPGSMFVPGSRAYAAAMTTVSNQDYLAVNTIAATLASSLQGTNVAVNWYGIAGVSYQLYYSSNLVNWLPYGAPIVGASSPIEVPVPVDSDPAKFFRVNAGN
jgi:hypothetical protein